jgi:hypothetical protein
MFAMARGKAVGSASGARMNSVVIARTPGINCRDGLNVQAFDLLMYARSGGH